MTTLRIAGGRVLHPDVTIDEGDVLIDQDAGEIIAVGDVGEGDETLRADGGLVMPGLLNAHTHVAMTLLRGYADDKPLETWLREDIWPVEAALTAEDVRAGAELGLLEMITTGTTALCDMYFFMDAVADAVERAGVRAVLGHGIITAGKDEPAARDDFEEGLRFAREYNGAADGRIGTALMPHSLTTVDAPYFEEYVPHARELGVPVHLHANETEREVDPIVSDHGQRPIAYARDLGLIEPEDFIAHGVHLDGDEIDHLAAAGAGVVHCPASNMKLASGIAPVQRLIDAGVPVGLGTDGAASNNDLDLFDEIRDAAMIGKLADGDARAVDAQSAVGLATHGSASILGLESGRIEPGANADVIVLDLDRPHLTPAHDLVSHLAYAARGTDVRHTVCDGEVLMQDREVLTLDETRVIEDARHQAADLLSRADA